jgi:hypothetical protein
MSPNRAMYLMSLDKKIRMHFLSSPSVSTYHTHFIAIQFITPVQLGNEY